MEAPSPTGGTGQAERSQPGERSGTHPAAPTAGKPGPATAPLSHLPFFPLPIPRPSGGPAPGSRPGGAPADAGHTKSARPPARRAGRSQRPPAPASATPSSPGLRIHGPGRGGGWTAGAARDLGPQLPELAPSSRSLDASGENESHRCRAQDSVPDTAKSLTKAL